MNIKTTKRQDYLIAIIMILLFILLLVISGGNFSKYSEQEQQQIEASYTANNCIEQQGFLICD